MARHLSAVPIRVTVRQIKIGAGMFEQTFKNLDDIMFQEPGCNTELDYVEQSSWMLFVDFHPELSR